MLKKSFIFALLPLYFAASFTINGTTFAADNRSYTTTSNIEQVLNAAVQKAEADVQEKFTQATRQDVVPLWADKVALENAIIQLEVKKTLVNNFLGTPSLNNPLIQEKLVEILNKSVITESDLAGLENLVNREKAKMNSNNSNKATTPTPSATPATTPATSQTITVPIGQ